MPKVINSCVDKGKYYKHDNYKAGKSEHVPTNAYFGSVVRYTDIDDLNETPTLNKPKNENIKEPGANNIIL